MPAVRTTAALLAAAALLVGCSSSTAGSGSGSAAAASTPAAPASHPTQSAANSSTPASAPSTPAGPAGPAPCHGAQITTTGHFDEGGSAAGHQRAILVFTNSSATACTLYGYPGVDGIPPRPGPGTIQHFTRTLRGMLGGLPSGSDTVPTVVLQPGQAASAVAEASSVPDSGATDCTPFQNLMATPPNTSATVTLPINELPSCRPQIHPVVAGSTG